MDQLAGANDELELELSVLPAVNFALVHNRVPILRHLSVRNASDKPLRDLAVSVELHGHSGALAEPWHREVPVLDPDKRVAWADLGEFAPHAHALSQYQEAFNATLEITASHPWGQPLRVAGPLRILAHNEWLANPALFDTIAAFVQPNARAVAEILREATEILKSTSGDRPSSDTSGGRRGQSKPPALYTRPCAVETWPTHPLPARLRTAAKR